MSVLAFLAMFVGMIVLMLLGIPIAVSMVIAGAGTGALLFGMPFLASIGSVLWGVMNDSLLTAAPLFILLGELLLRSGVADRMYVALAAWLSRLPGGLLHTNIGCCALFAATSGSSVATAATIGTVALPSLKARNYSMRDSLGSLAAGGTLGILIPPSVNMIVYGSLTQNSIGKLFIAGVIPGLLLSFCFMVYVYVAAVIRGSSRQEKLPPLRERIRLLRNLIPPFVVFGIVMGSIYTGVATATESAALGVVVALFFTWRSGRLSFEPSADLLYADGADYRDGDTYHLFGVRVEPPDQPFRRRRYDDQVGDLIRHVRDEDAAGAGGVLHHPGYVHGCDVDAGRNGADHISNCDCIRGRTRSGLGFSSF